MKQYKDMTNFPKIYERSYWGWFAVTEQNPTDIIINNRNKFVTDYNNDKGWGLDERSKKTRITYGPR